MDHRRTVPNRYAVLELSYWAIGLLGYWAIGLAIVSGLIPIGLVMAGSRLIGAVDTATLCVIEPIVAVLVSILILNEVSSSSTLHGGFLVIALAVLLVRTQQKNNRVPQQVT